MLLPPPPSYPPAFGNVEYDNGRRVHGLPAILARWRAAAAATRGRIAARLDIPYGDTACETFDLFEPRGRTASGRPSSSAPLLVFIHGGYWRSLSKNDFSWVAADYVARGIKVAIVDYALVPIVPLETIVRQNLAAIAWMHAHAKELGIARERIVVSGHSAGGHLTAMMLAARWSQWDASLPADVLCGGVAVSGLFDMEPLRHTPYLNADLQLTLDRVAPLSPLYMTPATDAPLVTAVGGDESDEFKRHTREIGIAWSHVLREDVALPGANHFDACERFVHEGERLFEATIELCVA